MSVLYLYEITILKAKYILDDVFISAFVKLRVGMGGGGGWSLSQKGDKCTLKTRY